MSGCRRAHQHHAQTQPEPTVLNARLAQIPAEEMPLNLLGNAGAAVPYAQPQRRSSCEECDSDGAALGSELESVGQQIQHCTLQQIPVGKAQKGLGQSLILQADSGGLGKNSGFLE